MFTSLKYKITLVILLQHRIYVCFALPSTDPNLPSLAQSNSDEEFLTKVNQYTENLEAANDHRNLPVGVDSGQSAEDISGQLLSAGFGQLIPSSATFLEESLNSQNQLQQETEDLRVIKMDPNGISEEVVALLSPPPQPEVIRKKLEKEDLLRNILPLPTQRYFESISEKDYLPFQRSFQREGYNPYEDLFKKYYKYSNNHDELGYFVSPEVQTGRSMGGGFEEEVDVSEDLDWAETASAAMFQPMFTYRYLKARKTKPKTKPVGKRHSTYIPERKRRPIVRHPIRYL